MQRHQTCMCWPGPAPKSCLRGFFAQGWCLGSSGAMACRVTSKASGVVNAPVLVTPSGVPKEQLQEEDSGS